MDKVRDYLKEIEEAVKTGKVKMQQADSEEFLICVYMFALNLLATVIMKIMTEDKNNTISDDVHNFLSNKFSNATCDMYEALMQNAERFRGQYLKNPVVVETLKPEIVMEQMLDNITKILAGPSTSKSIKPGYVIPPSDYIQ